MGSCTKYWFVRGVVVSAVLAVVGDAQGALLTDAMTHAEHGGDVHDGGGLLSGSFADGGLFDVQAVPGGGYIQGSAFVGVGSDVVSSMLATSYAYIQFDATVSKLPGYESLPDVTTMTTHAAVYALGDMVDATLMVNGFGEDDSDNTMIPNGGVEVLETMTAVNVNFPVTITMQATLAVERPENPSGFGDLVDFGGFFMHLGGTPAFILPEGYVVNSEDGQVVDNEYTGPVPEPVTGAMLGLGGLALVIRRRAA